MTRRYTLSGLINSLKLFEEELEKRLLERGLYELAMEAKKRREKIVDTWNMILVEMTLEPIYTVELSKILDDLELDEPDKLRHFISELYSRLSVDVLNVSPEFSKLFREFATS